MIRDLLVHVDASEAGVSRLRYALDLAARHEARLTGVHVIAPTDVPPLYKPSKLRQVERVLEDRSQRDALSAELIFREVAGERPTQTAWKVFEGRMADQLADHARYADLVIVGQYESEGAAEHRATSLADDLVVKCGRPLMVIPESTAGAPEIQRAVLAWDGSREAVRAAHDVIPLLIAAQCALEIVSIDKASRDVDELAGHLRAHGVALGETFHLDSQGRTGAALVSHLQVRRYDLLVIGAYSHSAWREFLLGGVTRTMLHHSPLPVFVSH